MSLHPQPIPPVPEETARVAQSPRATTHRLHPCVSQDPCAQPHVVRGSDHGLCVECADREVAPEWVRASVPAEWVERYGERLEHERLPKEEEERKRYANQVGTDGWTLLDALETPDTPDPIENAARHHRPTHHWGATV